MTKKLDKIFFIFGIIMLSSELWKQWILTYHINHGQYDWWYLPFQLCSIPMYLLLLLPLARKIHHHQIIYSFLMDYCLLCGIAVFFDISGMIYPDIRLTIHSFIWHILLIIIGLTAGISGACDYSYRSFPKVTAIYLTGCILATLINIIIHPLGLINMFYISPYYKMDQVLFRTIREALGNPLAILLYITTIISTTFLIHLGWHHLKKIPRPNTPPKD